MGHLSGLSGTDGKPREAMFFKGHTTLRLRSLIDHTGKQKYAYTSAGDKGAINIWIDDDGFYRVERQVLMDTRDSQKFKNFTQAIVWAKKALKLIK
jgi:hypothetical protein